MTAETIGSTDTGARYYAAAGKVYSDLDGREAGTALSANGAELERHARALEDARRQRAELDAIADKAAGYTAELVDQPRSHSLELGRYARKPEPFAREELYPTVRVAGIPRVGSVLVELSADRYVSSSDVMGSWRIVPRGFFVDDDSDPWKRKPAAGIGEKTAPPIRHAAELVAREWLETDAYRRSRRRAAAYAYRHLLRDDSRNTPALEGCRKVLDAIADELAPLELSAMKQATELLAQAFELVDREPIA